MKNELFNRPLVCDKVKIVHPAQDDEHYAIHIAKIESNNVNIWIDIDDDVNAIVPYFLFSENNEKISWDYLTEPGIYILYFKCWHLMGTAKKIIMAEIIAEDTERTDTI